VLWAWDERIADCFPFTSKCTLIKVNLDTLPVTTTTRSFVRTTADNACRCHCLMFIAKLSFSVRKMNLKDYLYILNLCLWSVTTWKNTKRNSIITLTHIPSSSSVEHHSFKYFINWHSLYIYKFKIQNQSRRKNL